jgi:polysaccharide export outer membrane protein
VIRTFLTRSALVIAVVLAIPVAALGQPAPAPQPASPPAAARSAASAPAAATPAPATEAGAPSSGDRNYILGIGDTIDVAVLGRSDFNAHARIGTDGAVLLPYLGAFPATNRSPGRLADEVRVALEKGGFFSNPVVRVDVVGVASRYVTVLGAVQNPGLVALDRQYRLSEIIARAGGRASAGAEIVVLTRGDNPPQKYRIADLATGVGEKDPLVEMGDKIYVPAAEAEIYYITGAVKAPGAFAVSGDMTVRQALARAGGVGDTGSEKKIKINRKGTEIKNVKLDETKVQAGDIINVGERLF